jgi:DNA-binding response OmpR family regulator
MAAQSRRTQGLVAVTADGRQARDAFDAEAFDLVMTDRAMPELHGDHLAAEVKRG